MNIADERYFVRIRANARDARKASAILSPTRTFLPVSGARGVYEIECAGEVQMLRDADFLRGMSVDAVETVR